MTDPAAVQRVSNERLDDLCRWAREQCFGAFSLCNGCDAERALCELRVLRQHKREGRKWMQHDDACKVHAICQHDSFIESIKCDHEKHCTCGLTAFLAQEWKDG